MIRIQTIVESGMSFVVPENELFYIESFAKSNLELKTVEFVWLANKEMKFVEAKSSAPQKSDDPEKKACLPEYIADISEKWRNSIQITASQCLGNLQGKSFAAANWSNLNVKLCLVLGNGFKKEWLQPLQDAFSKDPVLKRWRKVWNPKNPAWIKILNEETAKKVGLL